MKLSIIIPIYKVEEYIGKCLVSCIQQENVKLGDDYEIICINDGTPDKSADIAKNIASKYQGITVVDQENQGLSAARNAGMALAKGEYVWFVDSDDYIASDSIISIINVANGTEIINIGYQEEIDQIKKNVHIPNNANIGKDCLCKGFFQPAQFHVFKRSFLERFSLRFFVGIYHEDAEFIPRCLYLAENVENIQSVLYYYQIRGGSIMTVIKSKRAFDYLTVANSLIEFGKRHGESISTTPLLNTICLALNNALYIISRADSQDKKSWLDSFNENPEFVKALRNSHILKYKIEGLLFSVVKFDRIKLYNLLSKLK